MRQASSAASTTGLPRQVKLAGKLHDQDRVLAGQPDEHEEPDLGKDVVVALGEPHAADGAQERHRDDEDDRERQRPALVLRREHEEDQQDAQREDEDGRIAGQLLLIGQVGPLIADPVRQHVVHDTFDRCLRLTGAVPRGWPTVDVG